MTEGTRYVEVSWELPLRTVRGTPIAPRERIA